MVEISDAFDAAKLALKYLSNKGIIVYNSEIKSIFRDQIAWFITIDSVKFTGYVILNKKTGCCKSAKIL